MCHRHKFKFRCAIVLLISYSSNLKKICLRIVGWYLRFLPPACAAELMFSYCRSVCVSVLVGTNKAVFSPQTIEICMINVAELDYTHCDPSLASRNETAARVTC